MKKSIFYPLCIIFGVILYFLTPFIHYLSKLPKNILLIVVFGLFLLITIFGIVKLIKLPKGQKRVSLMWFIPAIILLVSTLPHLIFAQGKYHYNGYIIYRYDTSLFGVKDKWGKDVVPKSEFESLFFTGISNLYLVGVKYNGLTDNKVHEVRDIYIYKFKDGHFNPDGLDRIVCGDFDGSNKSIYSHIKQKVGIPMVEYTDYMSILMHNYVKDIEELELFTEIQSDSDNLTEDNKEQKVEGFEDLGEIEVYYYTGEKAPDYREGFHLLVKSVNGDNLYYICKDKNKYLVYKSDFEIRGWVFNGRAGDDYILVNPAWPLKKSEDDSYNEIDSDPNPQPSTNPSSQPRQLQPVSVWVPCPTCHNSGQCQFCYGQGWTYSASDRYYDGKAPCFNCGGNKKCTTCAGQGGHNEIQYR